MLPRSCQPTTDECCAPGAIPNWALPQVLWIVPSTGRGCRIPSEMRGNCWPAGRLNICSNRQLQRVLLRRRYRVRQSHEWSRRQWENRRIDLMPLIPRFPHPPQPKRILDTNTVTQRTINNFQNVDDARSCGDRDWPRLLMKNCHHRPHTHTMISCGVRSSSPLAGTGPRPLASCVPTAVLAY